MGDGVIDYWRWRSVRKFVRARHRPSAEASHLDQAEDLLGIAHAFSARWAPERLLIENRLRWLGLDDCRAHHLSDVVHLLSTRPGRSMRIRSLADPPDHSEYGLPTFRSSPRW